MAFGRRPRSTGTGGGAVRPEPLTPDQLRHCAAVMDAEAERRTHQPEFAAWLRAMAEKARREAVPAQGELFG